MKISLEIRKDQKIIYEGVHETNDASQFGDAFAAVWTALHSRRMEQATSVGQLMDMISDDVLDDIDGSTVSIRRL